MQLSEVVRRSIVVPKSEAALRLIETDQFSDMWIDEYFILHIDEEFSSIYASGIFKEINIICDSHIEDYAEEVIEFQKQKLLLELLSKKCTKFSQLSTIFCGQLTDLCIQASARHMPIYFVL